MASADLKYDTWGCERKPATLPAILLDSPTMRVTITPQFGGKVWSMHDKVANREFFFSNPAHQPANIGARGAWTAGGLEFNWSPGYLGHSAFTEERVWAAKLSTTRGDVVRVYEYDRYNGTVFQVRGSHSLTRSFCSAQCPCSPDRFACYFLKVTPKALLACSPLAYVCRWICCSTATSCGLTSR